MKASSGATETREGLEEALLVVRFNVVDGIVVGSLDRITYALAGAGSQAGL